MWYDENKAQGGKKTISLVFLIVLKRDYEIKFITNPHKI